MKSMLENISRQAARVPMLKALLPLIAGILSASRIALPLWGVAVGFGICIVAAFLLRKRSTADVYLFGAIFLAGWLAAELRYDSVKPAQSQILTEVRVDGITSQRDGRTLCDATMTAFVATADDNSSAIHASQQQPQPQQPQPQRPQPQRQLTPSRCKIRISADTSLRLQVAERVLLKGHFSPYDRNASASYHRYMARRGFAGEIHIGQKDIIDRRAGKQSFAYRMHNEAARRIERLHLPDDQTALTEAVTIGRRLAVTPAMRRNYTLSGAAHLLAVSGLHVGFVFVIINLLLWWMPAFRRGHLWRCLVSVVAIWLYAAVAGFSPAVTRAAVMFTLLQISIAMTARADTLNSLCFTAFIMLLVDARNLFDAGFLLSFTAVAAIIEWGVPLYRIMFGTDDKASHDAEYMEQGQAEALLKRSLRGGVRWLWSAFAVTLAASTATTPLASYLFGTASLWSLLISPLLIILSALLIGAALLWTLMPLGFLQPVASAVTGFAAGSLNALTRWCASSERMAFDVRIDGVQTATIYIAFIIFTLWLWSRRRKPNSF